MLSMTPIRETRFYKDVREEGREEGIAIGEQKGRQAGQLETLRKQLLKLWTLRFGPPVDWVAWRITECKSLILLDTLFEQVTLAPSPEEAQRHVTSALGNGT